MTTSDDNNSQLEQLKIDRQLWAQQGGGLTQKVGNHDPRFTGLIKWVWPALGSVALIIGWRMNDKLSSINDTLILAVSDIRNQGAQVADLKTEVRDLRASQVSLQRQVDSLEGKTLRGIEEIRRGP